MQGVYAPSEVSAKAQICVVLLGTLIPFGAQLWPNLSPLMFSSEVRTCHMPSPMLALTTTDSSPSEAVTPTAWTLSPLPLTARQTESRIPVQPLADFGVAAWAVPTEAVNAPAARQAAIIPTVIFRMVFSPGLAELDRDVEEVIACPRDPLPWHGYVRRDGLTL